MLYKQGVGVRVPPAPPGKTPHQDHRSWLRAIRRAIPLRKCFAPVSCWGRKERPRGEGRCWPCLTEAQVLVILLTMTTLPLGEVKSHLSELVGRVHDHHERVTVTVHGRPSAVLVAVEDLERLEETLAILRDAGTMTRLAESDAELARGESVSAAELAETMRRRSPGE